MGAGEAAAAWAWGQRSQGSGARGGEGETRDQHTPHTPSPPPATQRPPAPLPTTTHASPPHTTPHQALGLASPPRRRPMALHRQSAARPPSPPSTRRKGGGRVRTPNATRFTTPHAPRHDPRRLPESPSIPPAREGRNTLFSRSPAPPGTDQAGHGQPAKPGLVNDPSAGSPTETLLRLLLPLDSQVRPSSQRSARAVGRPRRGRSEGLTKPSNR